MKNNQKRKKLNRSKYFQIKRLQLNIANEDMVFVDQIAATSIGYIHEQFILIFQLACITLHILVVYPIPINNN